MWRQVSIVIDTYDDIAAVGNEISRLCHSELLDLSREGLVVAKIRDLKIISFYAKLFTVVFYSTSLNIYKESYNIVHIVVKTPYLAYNFLMYYIVK